MKRRGHVLGTEEGGHCTLRKGSHRGNWTLMLFLRNVQTGLWDRMGLEALAPRGPHWGPPLLMPQESPPTRIQTGVESSFS